MPWPEPEPRRLRRTGLGRLFCLFLSHLARGGILSVYFRSTSGAPGFCPNLFVHRSNLSPKECDRVSDLSDLHAPHLSTTRLKEPGSGVQSVQSSPAGPSSTFQTIPTFPPHLHTRRGTVPAPSWRPLGAPRERARRSVAKRGKLPPTSANFVPPNVSSTGAPPT